MKRTSLNTNQGFTIAEVMVAMLILAVTVFAMISTAMFAKQVQTQEVQINEATEVAQAVMESFRKLTYVDLQAWLTPGSYSLEQVGTVYDEELNPLDIVDSGLLFQLRDRLNDRRLTESIEVEKGPDAIWISVRIHTIEDSETPLVAMSSYVVENGINFN
jgi:prepilin-type N-terminal cleavage/methylation domain-containing protein